MFWFQLSHPSLFQFPLSCLSVLCFVVFIQFASLMVMLNYSSNFHNLLMVVFQCSSDFHHQWIFYCWGLLVHHKRASSLLPKKKSLVHPFSHFISFCLYPDREAERKITTGLYVGEGPRARIWGRPRERVENPEGSIFRPFSYTDRANKQSSFTLNLLRSLRNAVSYTWGSWRGVWNTFELGVSFSAGVYRDSVIVNSSSDAKVLVSSISTILQFLAGFFWRNLRIYCFCARSWIQQ